MSLNMLSSYLKTIRLITFLLLPLLASAATTTTTATSTCTLSVATSVASPSVAAGYSVRLVATNLTAPRGIIVDSAGHLLVVQQDVGIEALTFTDGGGSCIGVSSRRTVVADTSLNHGITLSPDGATLYASSPEAVYSYGYDAASAAITTNATSIIANMTTSDHTTRTLLLSSFQNGTLVVTRGSTSNVDTQAEELSSGHSQIKAFDLNNRTGTYNFNDDGLLLGWGLRNDVGIDEHPIYGGLYSVENSVDQMVREGIDVHENNPGEELNYLGTLLNNTSSNQGGNFGYPECFAAWNVSALPDNSGLQVGEQFVIDNSTATTNDTTCQQDRVAPRLVFQAHMAPLDIKFNSNGSEAWVTFHGSWSVFVSSLPYNNVLKLSRDRTDPVGYKVSVVEFANGEPVDASTSLTAGTDIVSNQNNSVCPGSCFRPVGLAWDSQGRLFFSSDATGEIYVVTRSTDDSSVDSASTSSSTSTSMSSASTLISTSATASGTSSVTATVASTTPTSTGAAVHQIGSIGGVSWFGLAVLSYFMA